MSKPDWCPQEVWDATETPASRVQIDVAAGQLWDIRPTIARAILEAEKRGESSSAARIEALEDALRRIAEGNLGDDPWQANYERIREVAATTLNGSAK